MSVQTLSAPEHISDQQFPSERARSGKKTVAWWCTLCIAVACLPVVYAHFVRLLSNPHYQFAALVPFGILAIWSRDLRPLNGTYRPLHWAPTAILVLGGAGLAAAAWLGSPWVGMIASLLLVLPSLWWLGDRAGWKQGWRGWLVAWCMVPLPLGMDEDLTVWLRTVTTKLTSRVLDELGVLHLSYANVIELPGKPLFIADACSGIHSLFVLTAAALFFAMWSSRSLLHTVLLLGITFILVIVENIARLAVVALAWRRQVDLSEGNPHLLLGIGLFGVSLLLVMSSDQFLRFLLPGVKTRVTDYFRKNPYYYTYEEAPEERSAAQSPQTMSRAGMAAQWTVTLCLATPLPLIGIYQVTQLPGSSSLVPQMTAPDLTLPEFGEQALPETVEGFERKDYQIIQRVEGDPMGRDSQQWTYRRGEVSVRISLDSPYPNVHDMCVCYRNIGWNVDENRIVAPDGRGNPGPVGIGLMNRPLFGHGVVFFSQGDRSGELKAILKEEDNGNVETRGWRRWGHALDPDRTFTPTSGAPFVQFHMLVQGEDPFDASQQAELLDLYMLLRSRLHELVYGEDSGQTHPSTPEKPQGAA